MIKPISACLVLCFFSMLAFAEASNASNASNAKNDNNDNNDVKAQEVIITTQLSANHPIVAEKVTVNYKISVLGFFNGGTQFELPSLSKVRLSQPSNFAINGSEFIDGQKYATQIWQIDLIPEQAGFLDIPALVFSVKYKTVQGVQKQETILSDDLAVFAYFPQELKSVDSYIVSSDVNISEEWIGEKDSYQVGDVLTRDITLTAADISSIQFPLLTLSSVDGIKVNKQEARLSDSSNRGEQMATLKQTIHYTFLQAGHFNIPKEQLNWWSMDDGLQTASLAVVKIYVAGFSRLMMIATLILISVSSILLFFYFRFKNKPPSIKTQLLYALKGKQWRQFIGLLYYQLDHFSDSNSHQAEVALLKESNDEGTAEQLLACEYKGKDASSSSSHANLNISALKKLITR